MSIFVNHDERREQILLRSISLFAEHGYSGVSYRSIADSCGLARTTIYKYFKNKREIFDACVKQVTLMLGDGYNAVLAQRDLSPAEKIVKIMAVALDGLFAHKVLICVIIDYLLTQKRMGRNLRRVTRAHTIGVKIILHTLLKEGIRNGDFPRRHLRSALNQLYGVLEAAMLEITVFGHANRKSLDEMTLAIVDGLLAGSQGAGQR